MLVVMSTLLSCAPVTADALLRWREEFPILARSSSRVARPPSEPAEDRSMIYLVSHSLGAMPRGAAARLQAFADQWATRGVRAWAEGWWAMPVEAGNRVAAIIGAAPGTVV